MTPAPVEIQTPETPLPPPTPRSRYTRVGFVTLFVLIGLSLLVFSGQILLSLTQTSSASAAQQPAQTQLSVSTTSTPSPGKVPTLLPTPSATVPFVAPNNTPMSPLQLQSGHYVLYQDETHIYLVSTTDNTVTSLYTPSYTYSQAVRPLLTPAGQLVYSGDQGIWITDLFDQQPKQIATLDPSMTVTSLALSQDGKMIAWTAEPKDGNGQINIYAGTLDNPQLVHQQSALDCPCLRIFSFLDNSTTVANTTLLLTDDRGSGSNSAVQYGLWALNISSPSTEPRLIMGEDTQQGPLIFMPYSTTLLYAPYEGAVPNPTDGSVPDDVAALSYANSMSLGTIDPASLTLGASQVVLQRQKNLANSPQASWLTTPTFSPDGQTLAYVEFSSDSQAPYDRHSALWTVQISGNGSQIHVGRPQLVAISTVKLFELGPWLNSHTITVYGDNSIYAMDTQNGAITTLVTTGGSSYLRILATAGSGQT